MSNQKIVLLLTSTLTIMSGATISASLPLIEETFSNQENVAFLSRLVLTVPALLIAIVSPVAGYLIDRLGRKNLLLASLVLYGLGGMAGGVVSNLTFILISRGLLGIAVAFIMTATATLIADYYDGEERSAFLGQQAAAISVGGIIFISLGGWLADLSWRGPFFVYGIAWLLVPLVWSTLSEPKIERSAGPTNIFKLESSYRNIILFIYLLIFWAMVIFYMIPVQVPFLLTDTLEVNSTQVGIAIATATLSGALVSLNFQRIRSLLHPAWIYAVAFFCLGAGCVMIYLVNSYAGMLASLFVAGLGTGLIMPNTNFLVMNVAPTEARGQLLGGLTTFLFLGQFFSPIITNPVAQGYSLNVAFLVAGLLALVGAAGFVLYNLTSSKQAQIKQAA